MKPKDRLSRWKKTEWVPLLFEEPVAPEFQKILDKKKDIFKKLSNVDMTKLARELIFDIKDGIPIIYMISPIFDTKKLEIKYDNYLNIHLEGNSEYIEKEIINILGLAVAFDVPIYPNSKKVEQDLAYYYHKLIIDGFTAPDGQGHEIRLTPTNSKRIEDFKIENITNLDSTKFWSPSDLLLVKNVIKIELLKLNNAQRTLTSLEIAISDFEELLNLSNRNENKLQSCLTNNPILFGLEYTIIKPKHKLGSEYEVDYALEKYSGLVDLMEIESSALQLFNKAGNPSSYLVHAEQQVIDWLDWVDKHGEYARSKVEGLISPKGFVIIGRDSSLNSKTKASLIRRNKVFNGLITILTYDDLLNKAKSILHLLKKEEKN